MHNNVEDKIILAAFELFVSDGFSSTTIEKIAKHAKVSKGLVYYYFKNKTQILRRIVEMIELPDSKLNMKEMSKMNLDEIFNYFLRLNYEYYMTIRSICQQPWVKIQRFYFEALTLLPEFYERNKQRYNIFIRYLKERFEKDYQFSDTDSQIRAKMMFALIEGLLYYLTFFPEEDISKFLNYPKNFFSLH